VAQTVWVERACNAGELAEALEAFLDRTAREPSGGIVAREQRARPMAALVEPTADGGGHSSLRWMSAR
jgi:hypothetical protein